jgi:ankyrin repeat protein
MKILALMILVFVGSNSFASASCESLFDRTYPSLQEINSVINELHSLRRQALTSDFHKSRIARTLFKQKLSELSRVLSESEIHKRLKEVKFNSDSDKRTANEKETGINNLVEVLEFLNEIKVPIDGKDIGGRTPLHLAVIYNRPDLVLPLIFLGIDINVSTGDMLDPLSLAVLDNKPEIVKILIHNGANVTNGRVENKSLLSNATMLGYSEIVEILKNAGATE